MDKKEVVKPLVSKETKRPGKMEFPAVRFLRAVGRGFILLAERRKHVRISKELETSTRQKAIKHKRRR